MEYLSLSMSWLKYVFLNHTEQLFLQTYVVFVHLIVYLFIYLLLSLLLLALRIIGAFRILHDVDCFGRFEYGTVGADADHPARI